MNLRAQLDIAREAALLGGKLNREAFRDRRHTTHVKGAAGANFATETDRSTERAIREFISGKHPDHRFLGEELGSDGNHTEGPLWIIDPIDGTTNFVHGFPHYAVSVGLAIDGIMQVAACLDVEREELFSAARGHGAWLDGKVIECSRTATVQGALIGTGFYYDRGVIMERTLSAIRDLFGAGIHGIRRNGSAVLDMSWVAAGRADAFFEYQLSPWDFLPASLVVEEAGALARDVSGEPLTLFSGNVVVANSAMMNELLSILQRE